MAKKAKEFAGGNGDDPAPKAHEELLKFEVMDEGVMLKSHKVPKKAVVELTQAEADNHRSRGVRLDDVAMDDTREVFQCRERYEAKDENAE